MYSIIKIYNKYNYHNSFDFPIKRFNLDINNIILVYTKDQNKFYFEIHDYINKKSYFKLSSNKDNKWFSFNFYPLESLNKSYYKDLDKYIIKHKRLEILEKIK